MENNLKNLSILYVEDDFLVQQNINKILSLLFENVFLASDGRQALKIFEENQIHIVLTDYEMPLLDGYEFAKKIREKCEKTPIIFLSNYTEKEKLLKCIPLKLTAYLEKPIQYEALLSTFYNCLKELEKNNILEYKLSKDVSYNTSSKKVYKNDIEISLTTSETKVFEFLFKRKNSLVTKEEILIILDSSEDSNENTVKNLIYRLRKKIGKDLIENLKFSGYILKVKD